MPPVSYSSHNPFRAQPVMRQHPLSRLIPEVLNSDVLSEPIPLPPPFAERFEVFTWHYLYHMCRRRTSRCHPRPTLGELAMTSHLTRSMCRRYRGQLERDLPPFS